MAVVGHPFLVCELIQVSLSPYLKYLSVILYLQCQLRCIVLQVQQLKEGGHKRKERERECERAKEERWNEG